MQRNITGQTGFVTDDTPYCTDHLTRVPLTSRRYRGRPAPAAFFVDGYQRARAFIVTERPTAATSDALWRIAWEQGVTGAVLIGTLEVRSGVGFIELWVCVICLLTQNRYVNVCSSR